MAFGDVSVVIRGPSSCYDPVPVGEGYRVGWNVGVVGESMNNSVEALSSTLYISNLLTDGQ